MCGDSMDAKMKLGIFLVLFSLVSLVLFNVKLFYIVGSESKYFTMFQFIGPIGGGLFSPFIGVLSVLLVELLANINSGIPLDALKLVQMFLPMAFAAYYFGAIKNNQKLIFVLPVLGMLLFWLNPIGREAWGYPLLWLIPIVAGYFSKNLFARSLATTFQAHIIGSVAWLYATGMPAPLWWGLIPVVLFERTIFACGISATYIAFNTLLEAVSALTKTDFSFMNIEKKYALIKL
jgi:hypothetical protein